MHHHKLSRVIDMDGASCVEKGIFKIRQPLPKRFTKTLTTVIPVKSGDIICGD
jgi:hypothetical protein